jgi:UbiA prenyltransferase family
MDRWEDPFASDGTFDAGCSVTRSPGTASARRSPNGHRFGLLAGVLTFLELVKFRYHITFINVIFGALMFAPRIDADLAQRLLLLYVSFNVLLYSGLYTLNDLADRESDARHPLKCARPIASRRISVRDGWIWTLMFVTAGFATGALLFSAPILYCYLANVTINLMYSWGGRNLPYLDVVLNGAPHVVRFLMGALLVGRQPPITHLLAFLLASIAFSCLRRRVEQDVPGWEARQSLRRWPRGALDRVLVMALGGLLALAIWNGPSAPGFYALLGGTAVVLIGGAYTSSPIRRSLRWVWTH